MSAPDTLIDVDASLAVLARGEHDHHGMLKFPTDLDRFAKLIAAGVEVVVETGTRTGGSARWFAEQGVDVITVDVHAVDIGHDRVTQVVGDSVDAGTVQRVAELVAGRRCMVTLDSDHRAEHVTAEVKAYGPMVSHGRHLVIEDTIFHYATEAARRVHGVGLGDAGTPMDAIVSLQRSRRWRRDQDIETLSPTTASPAGWWMRV